MSDLIPRVQALIIEGLHLEEMSPADLHPDKPLFGEEGLGLDSVDALEIVMEIERRFGLLLPDDASSREVLRSVRSIAAWIEAQGGG